MKTRKTLLTLALATAASVVSFAASAVIVNPDNDSATSFAYSATPAVATSKAVMPRAGEVSSNGLYVYSTSDRGWVARTHSFEIVAGGLAHTADCLPYNAPKPIAVLVPIDQRGVFGDHGA